MIAQEGWAGTPHCSLMCGGTGGFSGGSRRVELGLIPPGHLLSIASRSLAGIPSSKGSLYSGGPFLS